MGSRDSTTRMTMNFIFFFGLVLLTGPLVSHGDARHLGMSKLASRANGNGGGKEVNLGETKNLPFPPSPFSFPIPQIPLIPIPQIPLPFPFLTPPIPFPTQIPPIPPFLGLIPPIPTIPGAPPFPSHIPSFIPPPA